MNASAPHTRQPNEDPNRQPHDPEWFVGREIEIAQAKEWIKNPASFLLIIHGPPAIGKSWLMAQLGFYLRPKPNPPPYPIFTIAVRDMVSDARPRVGQCNLTADDIPRWLQRFLEENRPIITTLPRYDPVSVVENNVDATATALKSHFGEQAIYLLIDDGDLLTEAAWRALERKVIEPIHRVSRQFRFIVALREITQITLNTTSFKPVKLPVRAWPEFDGEQQLDMLVATHPEPNQVKQSLKEKVAGYDWRHPGLNYFLYRRIVDDRMPWDKGRQATLLKGLLSESLRDLLHATPSLSPEDESALLVWLQQLATIGESLDEVKLIELWPDQTNEEVNRRRDILTDRWLLVTAEDEWQWRLADGLRSFILACGPGNINAPVHGHAEG